MTWKFDKLFKKSISAGSPSDFLFDMCFDGKYIWVSRTNGYVNVYEYWGEQDLECKDELEFDKIYGDEVFQNKLREVKSISVPGITPGFMKYHNGKVYVSTMTEVWKDLSLASKWDGFISIDVTTYEVAEKISLPVLNEVVGNISSSNMEVAYDRLYWVYDAPTTYDGAFDGQHLCFYDLLTETFNAAIEIPGTQKQVEPIDIKDGKNGFIYITSWNDLKLNKFTAPGVHSASIRIGNRDVRRIMVNDALAIYVTSLNGMVTHVHPSTNVATNLYNVLTPAIDIIDDGTYMWAINDTGGNLVRMKKSNNNLFFNKDIGDNEADVSWKLPDSEVVDTAFRRIFLTPAFTYQNPSLQTVNVDKYIFVMTEKGLHCFKNTNYLYRESSAEISGVAMISTGVNDFIG